MKIVVQQKNKKMRRKTTRMTTRMITMMIMMTKRKKKIIKNLGLKKGITTMIIMIITIQKSMKMIIRLAASMNMNTETIIITKSNMNDIMKKIRRMISGGMKRMIDFMGMRVSLGGTNLKKKHDDE